MTAAAKRAVGLVALGGLVLVAAAVWDARAGEQRVRTKLERLQTEVNTELPPGTPLPQVMAFLEKRGLEHSAPVNGVVYAGIHNVRNSWVFKTGVYVRFYLRKDDTLERFEIEAIHTGP